MTEPDSTTALGLPIWLDHPERTTVSPVDIALCLSRLVRYAGARPVTVLHHTALVMELASARAGNASPLVEYAAAHDAHEAYTGDLQPGWKRIFPGVRELEHRWSAHVHRALGLAWPLPPELAEELKRCDRTALLIEMATTGHPHRDRVAAGLGRAPEPTLREESAWLRACRRTPEWLGLILSQMARRAHVKPAA